MSLAVHTNASSADSLKKHLLRRKEKNSAYSLRAFARDLGVSQAYLSLILDGQRRLSMKLALKLSLALRMSDGERAEFLQSVAQEKVGHLLSSRSEEVTAAQSYFQLSVDRFRIISEWYHLPILDLTLTSGFKSDVAWIASRLGISRAEARDAVHRLLRLKLLVKKGKGWVKTNARIEIDADHSHEAIRSFHQQMIQKSLRELEKTDEAHFSRRVISGASVCVNEKNLPQAIERLEKFRKEFSDFISKGECTEVFQLNLQFFSLLNFTGGHRK